MSLHGSNPTLPSLLLNSHTDVVPVTLEKWTHDPFSADLVDGKIYARGSQDMKSVGIAYLEAIRRLKKDGHAFARSVHLSFVPDEEIGGADGMEVFVGTDMFKALNVGFALDEGIPTPFPSFLLFNSERAPWCICCTIKLINVGIKLTARGNAGHGSVMLQGTAVERLLACLDKVRQFRAEQSGKLYKSDNLIRDAGKTFDVTTFTGATDARFLRQMGIPAIGFSPFRNTPLLLHDHDEHIGIDVYLEGISIYQSIIASLTS
ncbi:hypothetical protein PSACC_03432 [Paramicrosporidium saccamoebae]|uniref:N-acyl-L-amino-acid amidohydrolase n=1 Tax=Paramicrosporidium saccamoebae TaxID=1246581 RepID=A0A2H9TG57_9FUNG|nr:hypothetical protein PSACC_03432 [Paramicrosporidium saccamoebae]